MKKTDKLLLVSAVVSPDLARELVVRTTASLIGDTEVTGSTFAPYAAEYIGWLMDCFAQEDEDGAVQLVVPDAECSPEVHMGPMLFAGKAAMSRMYGTLRLDGCDSAFDPTTFDSAPKDELAAAIAVCSDRAVVAVQDHMAAVYQDMITGGSVTS